MKNETLAVTVLTETEGQMQMCFPASYQNAALPGTLAGNEKERWLFPRLLSFMFPFPITGIRIITLHDVGVFSKCPEAAALSAHKHLWEWMNHRVRKWTS
jgi:hypothetical protein